MPPTKRAPRKKTVSKNGKKTKKRAVSKNTKKVRKKTTPKSKKRGGSKTIIREVPVFVTNTNVPFMPFRALNTDLATNNLMGYMKGMIDGRNAMIQGVPLIDPVLIPTNTRRSERKPVVTRKSPPKIQGRRSVAQEIMDAHFGRVSRNQDSRTSVFDDLRRDLGVVPRAVAF